MPDEERVRQRAYEIWEREGRPEGSHDEHWERASREIEAEEGGSVSGTASSIAGVVLGQLTGPPPDPIVEPNTDRISGP